MDNTVTICLIALLTFDLLSCNFENNGGTMPPHPNQYLPDENKEICRQALKATQTQETMC